MHKTAVVSKYKFKKCVNLKFKKSKKLNLAFICKNLFIQQLFTFQILSRTTVTKKALVWSQPCY